MATGTESTGTHASRREIVPTGQARGARRVAGGKKPCVRREVLAPSLWPRAQTLAIAAGALMNNAS
ncbi:MAG: hypothetical protein HY281_02685 [Nitrospirae bacterium]|nr:hypothetical protein [Nitrospirota bacterium]